MSLAWTLPALLGLPLIGVLAISLGAAPRRTAFVVSFLNLIPGFLAFGVVLREGDLLFGGEASLIREVFPVQFRLGLDGLSMALVGLTLVVTLSAMGVAQAQVKRA